MGTTVTRWIVRSMLVLAALVAGAACRRWRHRGSSTCSSTGYRHQYCAANTQGRVLIVREVSTGNLCRAGPRLGLTTTTASGSTRVAAREFSYGRDDGGGGSWGRSGTLTCNSNGYRYSYCNADTQGRVSLVREFSTGNLCRQGSRLGLRRRRHLGRSRLPRLSFAMAATAAAATTRRSLPACIGAFALGAAMSSSQNIRTPPARAASASAAARLRGCRPRGRSARIQAYDPDSGRHRAARRRRRRTRLPAQRDWRARRARATCATAWSSGTTASARGSRARDRASSSATSIPASTSTSGAMPDIVALGEPLIEFNQARPADPHTYLQGFGGDTSNMAIAAARARRARRLRDARRRRRVRPHVPRPVGTRGR